MSLGANDRVHIGCPAPQGMVAGAVHRAKVGVEWDCKYPTFILPLRSRPEMTDSRGEIRTRSRGAGGIRLKCRLWVRCERQRAGVEVLEIRGDRQGYVAIVPTRGARILDAFSDRGLR